MARLVLAGPADRQVRDAGDAVLPDHPHCSPLTASTAVRVRLENSLVLECQHDGLAAFLGFLANEPAFAKMCIVDVLAAGPEAVARRDGAMRAFAQLITDNARTVLEDSGPPSLDLMAETVVGGIYEVVYARVLRNELEELPRLLPDLVYAVLLPYVGPEQAAADHRRLTAALAADPG